MEIAEKKIKKLAKYYLTLLVVYASGFILMYLGFYTGFYQGFDSVTSEINEKGYEWIQQNPNKITEIVTDESSTSTGIILMISGLTIYTVGKHKAKQKILLAQDNDKNEETENGKSVTNNSEKKSKKSNKNGD